MGCGCQHNYMKSPSKFDGGGSIESLDNPRALGTALKKVFKNDYGIVIDTRYVKTVRGLDGSWYEITTFKSGDKIPNEVRKELLELSQGKTISELKVQNPDDIYYGNIRSERVAVYGRDWKEWLKGKKFADGGGVEVDESRKWWGNDLSLNEQKEYAKKHLASFEYEELLGSTAQYSNNERRKKFINEIWEKEGKPNSKVKGLYSNGGGVDSDLKSFDVSTLDALEQRQYADFIKHSTKEEALKILITNVEGDFSQLSPELAKIAEKYFSDDSDVEYAGGGGVEDYSGKYENVENFISKNGLQQKFVDMDSEGEANLENWEDFTRGDFGTDEEVIEELAGKGYKIFYNEDDDEFTVTKKKTGKLDYKIVLADKKSHRKVLDVIDKAGIYSEYKPRFVIVSGSKIIGGSTYEIDDDNIYNFDLGILEKYQGYGIANKLIERIVADAKKMEADGLKAQVVNNVLLEYLSKIGFNTSNDSGVKYAYTSIAKASKMKFEEGGGVGKKVYIDFLNKKKGFNQDRKYFDTYENAVKWAKSNFERFDPDMIKYVREMADGGGVGDEISLWKSTVNGKPIKIKTFKSKRAYQSFMTKNSGLFRDEHSKDGTGFYGFPADVTQQEVERSLGLNKMTSTSQEYENGGGVDFAFEYQMLDRLRFDNDAYLDGVRAENRLWAGSVDAQIEEMKRLWNKLPEKPEWLSMEDILEYERKMKNGYDNGGGVSDLQFTSKTLMKSLESKVKEHLHNGEISMYVLESIIRHETDYPVQIVGALKLTKSFLRPYYKI